MSFGVFAQRSRSWLVRTTPTFLLAGLVLFPIVAIGLLGRHYSTMLEGIAPVDLTNFSAIRTMLVGVVRMSDPGDSWVPMLKALSFLREGDANQLYEDLFFAKGIRFQYPPTSLLPLDLLSTLDFLSLRGLSGLNFAIYCINAVGVGVVAWLLFHPARQLQLSITGAPSVARPTFSPIGVAILAVAVAFVFYPLVRAEVLGQIQVWIDALFTIAVVFWLRSRRMLAGVCIGLACTIKPQLGLLLIWGLLWQEMAFSVGILIGFVPIAAISLLRYGLHNHLAYLDVLAFLGRHGEGFFANNSVNGVLNAYFLSGDTLHWDSTKLTPYIPGVYAGTLAASAFAFCLVVISPLLLRGIKPQIADFGAAAICTVVGSPVAWEHHYGILLPLYLVALRLIFDRPAGLNRALALAALLLSWVLVANVIPFALLLAETPFRFAQAHCFFGALLLLLLLFGLRQRQAAEGSVRFRDDRTNVPMSPTGHFDVSGE